MIEELSRELGVADVTFMGFVPEAELPDYYSTATIMVFPSPCGFGLSSLEAMACGTPVIVAATLDAPEFIGDAGVLVRPSDPDDLARAVVQLLSDRELYRTLEEKGKERARMFSWERMADEVLTLYRGLLK